MRPVVVGHPLMSRIDPALVPPASPRGAYLILPHGSRMADLSLPDIIDGRPALRLQQNRDLLAHWEKLRGTRRTPMRSDFNPMALPSYLPHLVMVEPKLPDEATIRIFGSELVHRLGMDLTGHNLLSLYSGEEQEKIFRLLCRLTEDQIVAQVYSSWKTPSGAAFETENLWLPLTAPDGTVTRLLGSIWELEAFKDENVALGGSVADALDLTERAFFRF